MKGRSTFVQFSIAIAPLLIQRARSHIWSGCNNVSTAKGSLTLEVEAIARYIASAPALSLIKLTGFS